MASNVVARVGSESMGSFEASAALARLLANGMGAGTLPRRTEHPEQMARPDPYFLEVEQSEVAQPDASQASIYTPVRAGVLFPDDLALDARLKTPQPTYDTLPPSVRSVRRRRSASSTVAAPLSLASSSLMVAAVASRPPLSRLPPHARDVS